MCSGRARFRTPRQFADDDVVVAAPVMFEPTTWIVQSSAATLGSTVLLALPPVAGPRGPEVEGRPRNAIPQSAAHATSMSALESDA